MLVPNPSHDIELGRALRDLPRNHKYRYGAEADNELRRLLFRSLTGFRDAYLPLFFPEGPPTDPSRSWSLRTAQGAVEGAEYTEAARGHPCGHIFKSGEATYRCKTCCADDTCVLCAKCFDASDHENHTVYVSISPGNSGCCDCGDAEAWIQPMHCNIHSVMDDSEASGPGKQKETSLPHDLVLSIQTTVARVLDYFCDVLSCSPEQLRLPKTEETITRDERDSRLHSSFYGGPEKQEEEPEFALVLWNDEKHTVQDVTDQVARACKVQKHLSRNKALEVDDVGRSVVVFRTGAQQGVKELLKMAKIIEEIKLTVTIRSARDTFREQMCGTIIEWIADIAGCSVGHDHQILRETICQEMLKEWRQGSEAHHRHIGAEGLDDHETEDAEEERFYNGLVMAGHVGGRRPATVAAILADNGDEDDSEEDADNEWDEAEQGDLDTMDDEDEDMQVDAVTTRDVDGDVDMDVSDAPEDELETSEATLAGYPPPPPPPPPPPRRTNANLTPADSEGEPMVLTQSIMNEPIEVPKTPKIRQRTRPPRPPKYWLDKPVGYSPKGSVEIHEDLWRRVRLDWMILFDLRMWKKVRIDMRDVFIGTVVNIPHFRRLLGLRFAGLYTTLAQLYLIADREPDHSIINLSLQMLTTPTITAEIVERGNFLTNLMAILFTFLTTRQVGYPYDINPHATLAFDQGAVTNRRMYHFYLDMKYLLGSDQVKDKLCKEERYLLQFLDLVKLHQGICPNTRAVGEHLEYEMDAWISASLITREINKLCRQFAEAFEGTIDESNTEIFRAIRSTAKAVTINSLGAERRRFESAEIKKPTRFKVLDRLDFEALPSGPHKIVDFTVAKEPMSFHHALHYTLSWLVEKGKAMSNEELVNLMSFTSAQLKESPVPPKTQIPDHEAEDHLLAVFDYPLRVCAWLAQMRAGIWVRNGITLRHQMSTYRGVAQRDVAFQRDIFLLQVGLVVCPETRFLASMVDRFALTEWISGTYTQNSSLGFEDQQMVDVAEDFVHLLIILLSDRTLLLPPAEGQDSSQILSMRRDIAHILCFKPLSHSDLSTRLSEKVQDLDEFSDALRDMARFRPPEGLSDSGTFELKEDYIETIDPYIAQFSRNQREEAESIYKNHMAKKLGKQAADIVYEPKLRPIRGGIFKDLAKFTRTPYFTQVIYHLLGYAQYASQFSPNVPVTRIESYVQFILQLILVALQDDLLQHEPSSGQESMSFAMSLMSRRGKAVSQAFPTALSMIFEISSMPAFVSCQQKVLAILTKMHLKEPQAYPEAVRNLNFAPERLDTSSPASISQEDKELKRKQALERQAKVMAQFKAQQSDFLANQTIDWGEDDFSDIDDEDVAMPESEEVKAWKYPSGTCILCQEETNDQRLYGTFSYITESMILRVADPNDDDYLAEALQTPDSLDRSAEKVRPFGMASENKRTVSKVLPDGTVVLTERQDLAKGFGPHYTEHGPVATGCGHIMHYSCFEVYVEATRRRHANQIARNHPERPDLKEFICPLCKALGNALLPIIWKGKMESYPGVLDTTGRTTFDDWLRQDVAGYISTVAQTPERNPSASPQPIRQRKVFVDYGTHELIAPLATKLTDINGGILASPVTAVPPSAPHQQRSLPALLAMTQEEQREAVPFNGEASAGPALQAVPILELIRIYQRLRDVIKVNNLLSKYIYNPPVLPSSELEDLSYIDTLATSLGYSISAVEIAQRGVESEVGATLLDKISTQNLTHLRILSETATSYAMIGGLQGQGQSKAATEFLELHTRQLHQLFFDHPQMRVEDSLPYDYGSIQPLLSRDSFVFLAECSACLVPALHLDIRHVMQLCYVAEIVRVIVNQFTTTDLDTLQSPKVKQAATLASKSRPANAVTDIRRDLQNLYFFAKNVATGFEEDSYVLSVLQALEDVDTLMVLSRAISAYALPFLRKCIILMSTRYGVEFPDTGLSHASMTELQRLTLLLKLPSINDIFESVNTEGSPLRDIIRGWTSHFHTVRESTQQDCDVNLSHPAIFELVGLPKNYDALTDEAIRRRCPNTGKELTDPCVCLFCGDIFCSQAVCCMSETRKGGCWQHQQQCGHNIGLFINIRKCMVLFLNGSHGSWAHAPYLDIYGEVDPTLRRHHQLFLHQKRYDALLRKVWLEHGIPSSIARRLESEVNNGGWESL